MKKLLPVLLALCLIVSCFAVTASADTYTLHGTYKFTVGPTIGLNAIPYTNVTFICNGSTITYVESDWNEIDDLYRLYFGDTLVYSEYGTGWEDESYRTVVFNQQDVSEEFYYWVTSNAVKSDSIGESTQKPGVPSSAVYPSWLPYASYDAETEDILIMKFADDDIRLYRYPKNGFYVWGESETFKVHLEQYASNKTAYLEELETSVGSQYWGASKPMQGDYVLGTRSQIVYSSCMLYDEYEDLFFPETLWIQTQMMTQGAMKTEIPTIHSSMVLLALCGVGCLALLMALPLLKKILYRVL